MEHEAILKDAEASLSTVTEQLKNPYLSDDAKRSLWDEHYSASQEIKRILAQRKAEREAAAKEALPIALQATPRPLEDGNEDSDDHGNDDGIDDVDQGESGGVGNGTGDLA